MSEEIGRDTEGVSEISFAELKRLASDGKQLSRITFSSDNMMVTTFYFDDDTHYSATGFSIGYGGTGPHYFHKAIRLFHPEAIHEDFWKSGINNLDHSERHRYVWTPEGGFRKYEQQG